MNGHPALLLPDWKRPQPWETAQLIIDLGKAHFLTLAGGYHNAELVKIAKSIVLAPQIDNPSKWFDATK